MRIRFEEVAKELKESFVRIGGTVENYNCKEMGEVIKVYLEHHSLITSGDSAIIIDDLTGKKFIVDKEDFYTILIL